MASKKLKRNFKKPIHTFCKKAQAGNSYAAPMEYVIIEDGYLIASDAHVLVKQSLELHWFDEDEIQYLEGCCFHQDVFKEILTYDYIMIKENGIEARKGKVTVVFPLDKTKDMEYAYPNYKPVIPAEYTPTEEIDCITYNLAFINRISKVTFGVGGHVHFNFYGKNRATIVSGMDLDTYLDRKYIPGEILEQIILMPYKDVV